MPDFNDGFLVPARPGKPRDVGLTHVIDKGLNLRDIEGLFDTAGQFVDIVKFGWGTSYVTTTSRRRSRSTARSRRRWCAAGRCSRPSTPGRLDDFRAWLVEHRFSHVEISDGTIEIPRERKLELIADFGRISPSSPRSDRRTPTSSTPRTNGSSGSRKSSPREREGDHRGPRGRHVGDLPRRRGHAHRADRRDRPRDLGRRRALRGPDEVFAGLVREAVRPNVNLGNIPPDEVIAVETLRLGLRGDTLREVLLETTPDKG